MIEDLKSQIVDIEYQSRWYFGESGCLSPFFKSCQKSKTLDPLSCFAGCREWKWGFDNDAFYIGELLRPRSRFSLSPRLLFTFGR